MRRIGTKSQKLRRMEIAIICCAQSRNTNFLLGICDIDSVCQFCFASRVKFLPNYNDRNALRRFLCCNLKLNPLHVYILFNFVSYFFKTTSMACSFKYYLFKNDDLIIRNVFHNNNGIPQELSDNDTTKYTSIILT